MTRGLEDQRAGSVSSLNPAITTIMGLSSKRRETDTVQRASNIGGSTEQMETCQNRHARGEEERVVGMFVGWMMSETEIPKLGGCEGVNGPCAGVCSLVLEALGGGSVGWS